VYIQLADIAFDGKSGSELTADVRSKCSALLTKAKESYYLTMDRIRGDKHHVSYLSKIPVFLHHFVKAGKGFTN
jgi:hypothetical protein